MTATRPQQNVHYFACISPEIRVYELHRNWLSCFTVRCVHPTDLLMYCYVRKSRHMRYEFSLKFSSRETYLAVAGMFVIAVISAELLEELATFVGITLWMCARARVCV